MTDDGSVTLHFVTCVSNLDVLSKRLLASPCLRDGCYPLTACFNAQSAAEAFNAAAMGLPQPNAWLVWVHQDVYLPAGWDAQFKARLMEAKAAFPPLAVAGVYGVAGSGTDLRRAGHVLDRGQLLQEPAVLPCRVDSLDELLFAVQCRSGLRLDPTLPWDFYATDLVLQAQSDGYQSTVVDAYCEHWSDTPTNGAVPRRLVERIAASGSVFEAKWAHRLPVQTTWMSIERAGDVRRLIDGVAVS
jgi:hypothetical protein